MDECKVISLLLDYIGRRGHQGTQANILTHCKDTKTRVTQIVSTGNLYQIQVIVQS